MTCKLLWVPNITGHSLRLPPKQKKTLRQYIRHAQIPVRHLPKGRLVLLMLLIKTTRQ